MASENWVVAPPTHNYLVTLVDQSTFAQGRCIMRISPPTDKISEFQSLANDLANAGQLMVRDRLTGKPFQMTNPKVIAFDAHRAAHVPVAENDLVPDC